jgi:hypothetical protein
MSKDMLSQVHIPFWRPEKLDHLCSDKKGPNSKLTTAHVFFKHDSLAPQRCDQQQCTLISARSRRVQWLCHIGLNCWSWGLWNSEVILQDFRLRLKLKTDDQKHITRLDFTDYRATLTRSSCSNILYIYSPLVAILHVEIQEGLRSPSGTWIFLSPSAGSSKNCQSKQELHQL